MTISSDLTDRECAIRAAALIDTDGSISITKSKGEYTLRCTLTNTDIRLVEWMKAHYHGSIQIHHPNCKDGYNRKPIYQWSVASDKATQFLHHVYHFLIIKQQQALVGAAFRMKHGRGIIKDRDALEKQEHYYQRMKELNK